MHLQSVAVLAGLSAKGAVYAPARDTELEERSPLGQSARGSYRCDLPPDAPPEFGRQLRIGR